MKEKQQQQVKAMEEVDKEGKEKDWWHGLVYDDDEQEMCTEK